MSQIRLRSFDNFAALDTSGTDLHAGIAAIRLLCTNGLKVRVETPPRLVVSVRYVISKLRTFSAYVAAFCHNIASQGTGNVFRVCKNSKRYL